MTISVLFFAAGCAPQTQTNQYKDPQLAMPAEGEKIAIMETDLGTIKFRLFTQDVPILTRNFMGLARAGKYDGSPFHRVVKNFMIQGGDFTNQDGTGGYSYKGPDTYLPNEINAAYHHLYGTVSMAKSSQPVSIGSQFFIVTDPNGRPQLDGGYSPIGQVYEGMDVAEKIADLEIGNTEKPGRLVKITKVTISSYTANPTGATQQ